MRKRISIGLLAVVVIGLGVYLVAQPRKGSLEYHKRKYRTATHAGRIGRLIEKHGPSPLIDAYWQYKERRAEFHWQALGELGYLGKRVFVISNHPPADVAKDLGLGRYEAIPYFDWNFVRIRTSGTNKLEVGAPSNSLDKLGELIREADVPERGSERNQPVPHPDLLP